MIAGMKLEAWLLTLKATLQTFPWRETARTLAQRFREDRLGNTASSLTFTTLISMVPLFTVVLAMAGILWQGRARRARLSRVVSTPAAQGRPALPSAPQPPSPPVATRPPASPSVPQPPSDDLLQGLLANTPVPPASASADLPQALAAIKRGDLDAGSALLREVTAREPGNAEAWLNLGIIAVRRRDWGNARRYGLAARQLGHPQADTFLAWLHQQEANSSAID